jgi:NhaP-type Na+/H+ or K+/H+ antiporter
MASSGCSPYSSGNECVFVPPHFSSQSDPSQLYIGEAIWAFVFGVIIGPYCANIFDPRGWGGGSYDVTNTITLEFTRVVLAIGVFAIGVELPKQYMKRHWKSLFFLLVPIMTYVRSAHPPIALGS